MKKYTCPICGYECEECAPEKCPVCGFEGSGFIEEPDGEKDEKPQ